MVDSTLFAPGGAISASLVLFLTGLAYTLVKGYQRRSFFNSLRKQGLPMPPWSPLSGHLLALEPVLAKLPKDTQLPDAFEILCKENEKDDGDSVIYLDVWPFAALPLLVICSPTLAVEACQEHDLIKPDILHQFFNPLAGGDNLFTMNGPEWKRSRALFNPGFSSSYILQQTGHIVDEAEIYVSKLRDHARRGDLFSLDDLTCWYTMDIIGAVTLDSRLQSQTQFNPLASAMRSQINWQILDNEFNLFVRWNPARPFVQAYNSWQMNKYISRELDKRYAEWIAQDQDSNNATESSSRSVMHIVLAGYMEQQQSSKGSRPKELDPAFKKWAIVQIRLFLFAGHDSTSSAICYIFYLLQSNPLALAKLREEHDTVFGPSIETVPDQLRENPSLINQLPYTTAVIKETLRLFPPASAMRGGQKGVYLTDAKGNKYPTEGTNLWILHSALQKNEKYWPEPLAFKPERWLVTDPADPLYPVKGGWRPFEHGPRNCLGQTLAMLDIKITLALTVREFDVASAYDEWDSLHPKETKGKIKRVNGERAYQMQTGGAHPADGFPCRVRFRRSG